MATGKKGSGFGWMSVLLVLATVALADVAAAQEGRSGESYDLDRCISLALENNLSVIQSRNERINAEAGLRAARGNWLPRLSLNGNSSRSGGDQYFATLRVPSNQINANGGLAISQTIFRGGYNFAQYRSAREEMRAADYGLELSRRGLVLQTKQAYFELLRNQGLLSVARENGELSRQQLGRARSLVVVGISPPTDTLTAKLQLAQIRSLLISRLNDVELSKADLCYIMGIDVGTPIELVDVVDHDRNLPDLGEAIDEAFLNRPDLKRYQANLEQAKASIAVARSSRLPSLTGSVRYSGGMTETFATGAGGGAGGGSQSSTRRFTNWSFGLGFNVSLYDGYATGASIQRALVARDNAAAQLSDLERSIALSVRRAHLNLKQALENMDVAGEQVALAEENLKLAAERYRVGKGTSLEYQTAQVSHLQARNGMVDALYNIHLTRAALDDAIHGSGRSVTTFSGTQSSSAGSVTAVGTMSTRSSTSGGFGGSASQSGTGGERSEP